MTNTKFIKIVSIFMLALVLVSAFSLPVLAEAEGDVEVAPASFWDQLFDAIMTLLGIVLGAIIIVCYAILAIIVILLYIIFALGEAIVDLIMLIVNAIRALF